VRLRSPDRLRRAPVLGPLSSSVRRLHLCAHAKVWGGRPSSHPGGHRGGGGSRVVIGALAIKEQGIYFANITLALSQMVYFFYLQALSPREDASGGAPRHLLVSSTCADTHDVLCRAGIFLAGSSSSTASSTRRSAGAQGHPGERTAAVSLGYSASATSSWPSSSPARCGTRGGTKPSSSSSRR